MSDWQNSTHQNVDNKIVEFGFGAAAGSFMACPHSHTWLMSDCPRVPKALPESRAGKRSLRADPGLADWSPLCRLCRWPLSVQVKECVDCSHLPLTAQGLSPETHLPVSSPLLPRNQNYSVTHQTPVPQLLHPKLVTQRGYHLSFPSQPYSASFRADAGTFRPLGSLGPEEERWENLKVQTPRLRVTDLCVSVGSRMSTVSLSMCIDSKTSYTILLHKMINW